MKKQSGFTIIETLLVLILVAIIGFTGYYVWNSQKQTNKSLDVTNDSTQTTAHKKTNASSQKYLTLSEWDVKIPLTSALIDAYYVFQNGAVYLSLNSYKGTDCAADSVSLGAISRFTASDRDSDTGVTLLSEFPEAVKVGQYYYNYQHPQSACDGRATNDNAGFDDAGVAKSSALMREFKVAANKIVIAN